MSARIFLPARRDNQVLVFEHRERREQRRWEFVAIAAADGDAPLTRTGNGGLNAEELAECQRLAGLLPGLEQALDGCGMIDLSPAQLGLDLDPDLAIIEGSPVLTIALYLHLRRDALVTRTSVQRYLNRSPEERFELGLTASIYASLLKVHDLNGASEMIDADMKVADTQNKTHREWGYLFNQAALLKQRCGQHQDAIDLYQQAADRWPSADIWRRIGNAQSDLGQRDKAIEAFLKSDAIAPLEGIAALRIARWLAAEGRTDEARNYAQVASNTGAPNASALLEDLDKAS